MTAQRPLPWQQSGDINENIFEGETLGMLQEVNLEPFQVPKSTSLPIRTNYFNLHYWVKLAVMERAKFVDSCIFPFTSKKKKCILV